MVFMIYNFTKSRLSGKLSFWECILTLEATVGPVISEGDRGGPVLGKEHRASAGGGPHWAPGSSVLGFSL